MNLANDQAEAAVLGSVLIEGELFTELIVSEAHFQTVKHKKIYQAMKRAHEQGQYIDLVTVTTNLANDIQQVGGTIYMLEMTESIVSPNHITRYQNLILEAYRNQKSRDKVMRYAEAPNAMALDDLIGSLEDFRDKENIVREKKTYDYLLEIADEMCTADRDLAGYKTTYSYFDEMTGGLQQGDLIIIAARPSVGKTAFALNIAAAHCNQQGSSSIFSLEMGTKQLLKRLISAEGNVDSQKWRQVRFNQEDYINAARTIGEISSWKLSIHENTRTVSDIKRALRKIVNDHPTGKHIAIIDYLQLITPAGHRERRDLEVGEITRELKLLALELNMPIVLLSQLSRSVEQRQDKRPFMSDLRESGNIEQDADVIAFLYRDDYYNKNSEKQNNMEIILAKQRNGPIGTVEVGFFKEIGRFFDIA